MQNVQSENTRGIHRYVVEKPSPPGYQESALANLLTAEGTRPDSAQHQSPPKCSPVPPSLVDNDSMGVVDKVVSERHPLSTKLKRKEPETTDGGNVPDQQALRIRSKKARQPSASARSAASEMTIADAVAELAAKPTSTRRRTRN